MLYTSAVLSSALLYTAYKILLNSYMKKEAGRIFLLLRFIKCNMLLTFSIVINLFLEYVFNSAA